MKPVLLPFANDYLKSNITTLPNIAVLVVCGMVLVALLLPGCDTPGARHPDEERADKFAKSRGVH